MARPDRLPTRLHCLPRRTRAVAQVSITESSVTFRYTLTAVPSARMLPEIVGEVRVAT